ncbi:hypothetical protein SAMN02983004_00939 [Borreliella japonica]|uniref:Uncharacterized protein n=1 Tax=Borreliella japonica TaxID=34095 RepID=A0A1G4Q5Q1_BORJA|nr:hypothetical protein SAMN02983004_00939 [Borreliella japonica]
MQADGPQDQVAQGVNEDPQLKKEIEGKIKELEEVKDSSKKTKKDRKKRIRRG